MTCRCPVLFFRDSIPPHFVIPFHQRLAPGASASSFFFFFSPVTRCFPSLPGQRQHARPRRDATAFHHRMSANTPNQHHAARSVDRYCLSAILRVMLSPLISYYDTLPIETLSYPIDSFQRACGREGRILSPIRQRRTCIAIAC